MANNLFFGNTAIYGAGVSMGWATPRILNNTIAYNSGTVNCGINLYMSVPELANNVVAFNGFVGIGVNNGNLSGVPNIHHNLVYGNGGLEINVFPIGPGNFYCDPLFVNPALGDFRVQAASPAIDRGDNSVANSGWLSLDGNARILNGFVDIGAFESLTARIPDITPPVTTAVATPGPNGDGWNKTDVAIALTATDDDCCFGVKQIVYTLSGAQTGSATVPGASASVTITAEGVTTLTYHAVDSEGNVETAKALVIRIDKTAPLVSYTGLRTYDVSETINIAFTATDSLSGIASSSGDQVSGVAADTLPVNQDLLVSASATDKAGNTGSASGQYRVIVTFEGLCQLVDRWVTQPGVRNSLCQKLRAAKAARERGNVDASNNILDAFIHEVEAQSGKAIPADKATTLIRLAQALKS